MRVSMFVPIVGVGLAVLSCAQPAQERGTLSPDDVAALEAIAEQDASIVMGREWDKLTARFAPNAVRMPPNAPAVEGRDAIRASLEGMPPLAAFGFRMVDLMGDGQLAYMRAAWSITMAPPGASEISDSGKILIVFAKQSDGSWLTVADAWNSDLPPAN